MTRLSFDIDWQDEQANDPVLDKTTGDLRIMFGDFCLTENVDTWSEVKRNEVLVSAYPLAIWLASSWWRLQYEVLPVCFTAKPPQDWRQSHEMTAANYGYAWPLVMLSTDRKVMNAWVEQFPSNAGHSVRYLTNSSTPNSIPMSSFTRACSEFIEHVLDRLTSTGCANSDLEQLWSLIRADSNDPIETRKRRFEAQFGFDPEDCPEHHLAELLAIEDDKGDDVLAELSAVRTWMNGNDTRSIRDIFEAPGIEAQPELPEFSALHAPAVPWEQAKADAAALRQEINAGETAVSNSILADLFGVDRQMLENQQEFGNQPVAIAGRIDDHRIRFVPQKRHPIARRFEWARLLGGYADAIVRDGNSWLASTDAGTARQKYQRAFAAEFLCPICHLTDFLGGDFSESKVEDAATAFDVSDRTVCGQLKNNRILPRQDTDFERPYSMVA